MKEIHRSDVYIKWLKKLRDPQARMKILARVDRLAAGNSGDSRFLGDISELRIDSYRVYYKDTGKEIIILLCAGVKDTQQADIKKAREIAKSYEGK